MASKKFLQLIPNGRFTILNLGDMEIWDGADMALLRETLTRLIKAEKHRAIGVDMSHVKYIPSGFFGMLFDWHETGVQIRLYSPQPNVCRMLWFSRFFEALGNNSYQLAPQRPDGCRTGYPVNGSAAGHSPPGAKNKVVARAGH